MCEKAAKAVENSDIVASTETNPNWPKCYLYGTDTYLWFNNMNNNAQCSNNAQCLCTFTCPPKQYQDQSGQTSCKVCASGRYSTAGASGCPYTSTSCPVGTYYQIFSHTLCDSCASGKYNDQFGQTGQTSCKGCPSGWYQRQSGQSGCTPCNVFKKL
jgi:hypothetical protein